MNDNEQNNGEAPSRYELKPLVEVNAAGYTKIISRVLLGAGALGVAGKLGELAFLGLGSGNGWTIFLGVILGAAAIGMFTISVPVFIFAFAGWIGEDRFHGRQGLKDPYGVVFAIAMILIFVALTQMLVLSA
ncbi:hypothetical protein GCM10011415_14910 [Salipiger pallidus]|uniref:Uncharacterized protein n=1 Tax=Salipiger pallidus TaxID=1775170 RepID=A0A8J2ZJ15_9RHOB|nr:hypothetical protein [Salipiger pallidus]GGG68698.1 hypothetical protein GCM10011415_14910 [Salipiger pallidus]